MENEKKLTATRFEVEQQLNHFIGNLKVEGMSKEAKKAIVMLKIELGKVIKEIDEFRKTTIDSIGKPDNYEELKEAANKENATKEDKEAFEKIDREFNMKFNEVALPFFNEVITFPFDFLSKDDFMALVENNDINLVFGYEYIYNKLVKE